MSSVAVAAIVLAGVGLMMSVLLIWSVTRLSKLIAVDFIIGSLAASSILPMIITIYNVISVSLDAAVDCAAGGFFIMQAICIWSMHAISIPMVFDLYLSKRYMMSIKLAFVNCIVIWSVAYIWSAVLSSTRAFIVAPGGACCIPDVITDGDSVNPIGGMLAVTIPCIMGQMIIYGMIYWHINFTFTATDDFFDANPKQDSEPVFGVKPATLEIHVTPPPLVNGLNKEEIQQSDKKSEIQRKNTHHGLLRGAIFRSTEYVTIAALPNVAMMTLFAKPSAATANFLLFSIVIYPILIVLAYGGNNQHHRNRLFCQQRRGSNAHSEHSASGSQQKPLVAVQTEKKTSVAGSLDHITYLDDGLKLVINKTMKVPTLEGLTIQNLLSYDLGVKLAIGFSEKKGMQCENNIKFYGMVQQYIELTHNSTDERAACEYGKEIMKIYFSGKIAQANVDLPIIMELREYFRHKTRGGTGKEFDMAIKQVCFMLNNGGFMKQFRESQHVLELAKHLAQVEKNRRLDDKKLIVDDLEYL